MLWFLYIVGERRRDGYVVCTYKTKYSCGYKLFVLTKLNTVVLTRYPYGPECMVSGTCERSECARACTVRNLRGYTWEPARRHVGADAEPTRPSWTMRAYACPEGVMCGSPVLLTVNKYIY